MKPFEFLSVQGAGNKKKDLPAYPIWMASLVSLDCKTDFSLRVTFFLTSSSFFSGLSDLSDLPSFWLSTVFLLLPALCSLVFRTLCELPVATLLGAESESGEKKKNIFPLYKKG